MKNPDSLPSVPLPWGQNAELEFTSPAVALTLVPLAEGESPHAKASEDVQLEVKETGKLTRVVATPAPERFNFWRSMPRVWLYLPRDVHARVSTDAGALMAEGFSGCELQMTSSAGVLHLRDVHGKLFLRASAGAIQGSRVGGVLDVETGAGSVKLDVDRLEVGTHRIRSSMGSVRVLLAAGMDVRLEPQTTLGSVRTRYPSRPDATTVLQLETELGSVRVRESNPGRDAERDEAPRGPEMRGPGRHWRERRGGWMHEPGMHGPEMHGPEMHGHERHGRDRREDWLREARRHGAWAYGPWLQEAMKHRAWAFEAMRRGPWRHEHEAPPAPFTAEPAARGATTGVADEELRRILTLVQEQKLTAEQAEQLLRAMTQR